MLLTAEISGVFKETENIKENPQASILEGF